MSRIDWNFFPIVMFAFVLIFLICDASCHAQEQPTQQYLEFPDFTGGLNLSNIGKIQPNQCLELSNFLIDNGEIRVRDGYGHISTSLGSSPVTFLGLYRKQGAAGKLFVQAGNRIYIVDRTDKSDTTWSDNEYTDNFFSTGTVSTGANGSLYFYTGDSTSKFESYYLVSVDFDSTGQTTKTIAASHAVNDSTIKLASAITGGVTGWTYSLSSSLGDIVSGETFVDSFYLATSTGLLRYNDNALYGTITPAIYRGVPYDISTTAIWLNDQGGNQNALGMVFQFDSLDAGISEAAAVPILGENDAYVKVSLRAVGAAGGILNGEIYHLTLPVFTYNWLTYPTAFRVVASGGTFLYDETKKAKVSIVQAEIDQSSKITFTADSIIYRGENLGTYKSYTIIVDDSLMSGKDSTFLASGDYFYCIGSSIIDDNDSKYSSVIGNYIDDSSRIYVTNTMTDNVADTIRTNVVISLFRRRLASEASTGVNAAIFWNDRYSVVYDTSASQVDFSGLFTPNTASGYIVQVNPDDGEPILWLKQLYGTLIIGKNSSIWKLTGVPGVDAFAQLSKSIDGISFIAPKSIVTHNNLMFGLGNDGFYVYDFNSMVKISTPIDDILSDSLNWNYVDKVTGAFFDDHFWWAYPSRVSTVCDKVLVYNPHSQAWATTTMAFSAIYNDKGVNDTASVYLGSPTTGRVYLYGTDNDDDGTAISASLKTGWFNMGTDWHDKIVNRGLLSNHRKSATSLSLSLLSVRPEGVGASVSRSFSGGLSNYRGLSRAFFQADQLRGTQYQLTISATTADSLRIGSVGLEYQVESVGY